MSDRASYDEMVNGHGGVRPHWRSLLGALSGLDHSVLTERVRRLGLAAEEEGAAPSWRCDPVPLPLTAAEFATLERGLSQRARLLEAILSDVYGPQRMLEQGALPPAAVHANPGYLRACRSGDQTDAPFLQAYAADLMRGPDGQWRVLADRTGGALGIGYARESRRLLARVLPELFRSTQVRQLRPFFEAWQDALLRRGARADGRPPVVAMLTPGPSDPHWPEHLAVSRDLACALVEARDLTVRGGVLSIKTLEGLQAVDVLVRRVSGATLDPLELVPGGPGVAGLLDVAREGNVLMLNHPGAAAIEAPVFAAFMPGLARRLLGEALLLPTVPTVWLADDGAQRMMSQGFERWSIRPALDGSAPPAALNSLSREARAALERQMAEMPWAFVGCTALSPSRAPGYALTGLDARPVVLRLFLMHDGQEWRMMQGGLARILMAGEHVTETLPVGATFKDVWVMSEDTGIIRGPEPVAQPRVGLRRTAGNLPSRVADDFYWLGRYVERLDAQARLGRAGLLRRARGAPLPREIAELQVLTRCLRATGLQMGETGLPIEQHVRISLAPHGSIAHGLENAARLIEALRDRMTVETHGAFTDALRSARTDVMEAAAVLGGSGGPGGPGGVDVLVHAMAGLQRLATTIAGVAAEGMVRGGGRLFLDLGRRIERAMVTGYVLATVLDQPPARLDGTLRMALELCDSAITYRSRYLSVLQPAPVLDLVLADTGNPRALAYQFESAAGLLEDAGDADLAVGARQLAWDVAGLVDGLVASNAPELAVPLLSNALIGFGNSAAEMSERVTRRFFALLPKLQAVGLETS
jgi:uncharacterized circularly permuted ATP-grasp superfamily protein/uncharacterized alpha-E superfamily protein